MRWPATEFPLGQWRGKLLKHGIIKERNRRTKHRN
jgi:hypothetical protein